MYGCTLQALCGSGVYLGISASEVHPANENPHHSWVFLSPARYVCLKAFKLGLRLQVKILDYPLQ